MGLRTGVAALVISAATTTVTAQTEREYDFWSFLKNGTVITPCAEDSAESKAAEKALEALNRRIEAASASTPLQPLVLDFHALLKSRCFQMAVEDGDPPTFPHVLSLKDWWEDSARSWLAGYLREHRYGLSTDLKRITDFPGGPRSVLMPFRVREPLLKGLVCPPDQECPGVKGWRERAEMALTPREVPRSWSDEPVTDLWRACENHAKTVDAEGAYQAYRLCLQGGLDFEAYDKLGVVAWRSEADVASLPIGNFRAPNDGWLAVSGRRGHYEFCDGTALFDLKTGSAFKSDSCSGLVLRHEGSVDFSATDAKRKPNATRGRVSVDNLRELVWMLLMKPHIDARDARRTFPVPDPFVRRWKHVAQDGHISGGSAVGSSAQTRLDWRWIAPDGAQRAGGQLTWPPWFWGRDRAESHAAELLSVMEGSLEVGCPAARPAPEVEVLAAKSASRDDRLERLLDSAPSEEAKESMRAMLKKLAETEEKREPVDPPVERESPGRRLAALLREPCALKD